MLPAVETRVKVQTEPNDPRPSVHFRAVVGEDRHTVGVAIWLLDDDDALTFDAPVAYAFTNSELPTPPDFDAMPLAEMQAFLLAREARIVEYEAAISPQLVEALAAFRAEQAA